MPEILDTLVNAVKEAYGTRVRSVVLYGSQASSEATKKHSDHNILIILTEVQTDDLGALSKSMRPWVKAGNPPPLLFDEPMFMRSADVFPIEFLDMKDKHRILYGGDVLAAIKVDVSNLRHECEYELKGKLLSLRQDVMVSGDNPSKLKSILIGSVSGILVLMRHVVRLLGETPPVKKMDALKVLANKIAMDSEPFETVMQLRDQTTTISNQEILRLMQRYLSALEQVVQAVDKA